MGQLRQLLRMCPFPPGWPIEFRGELAEAAAATLRIVPAILLRRLP